MVDSDKRVQLHKNISLRFSSQQTCIMFKLFFNGSNLHISNEETRHCQQIMQPISNEKLIFGNKCLDLTHVLPMSSKLMKSFDRIFNSNSIIKDRS